MKTLAGILGHSVCIFGASLFFHLAAAGAQPAADSEPPPAAALSTGTQLFCALPLCRDAEGLRRAGDLQGALKLYRYIQDEVDVDEKVVPKQLLWFTIATLHGELQQPQQGLEALQKYQLYISTRPDGELPVGQRRADSERLAQDLRTHQARLRIGTTVPGLRVRIDGKDVGVTPLGKPVPLPAGRHHVELGEGRGEGRGDAQEVEVAAGQEVLIWPLNPAPRELALTGGGVDGGRAARPRWRLALGSVGLGVGVTLVAVGAAALANDGQCVSGAPRGQCPVEVSASGLPVMRVVDGRAIGGGLVATGVLLSAAGAILVALPGKRIPLRASVSFVSGASLGLAGSF